MIAEGIGEYGPKVPECDALHERKYRLPNELFYESQDRIAAAMADDDEHRQKLKPIFRLQRFMGAGRIQSAMGSPKNVTAFNCFVSGIIEDSMNSIMDKAKEAANTMRKGGGIGYDFSRLRPKGDRIVSLDSASSGPLSFMDIYNSVCKTIVSTDHRRGAMMGVMRVDHPDIEEFIRAKRNSDSLTFFNVSVGVTDAFMEAVENDGTFDLVFNGKVYNTIKARPLWEEIMRSTWDWAEPGVLFLDRINEENNLWYCETIEATNPCGEQPLPPYGACLLGSFNLVKYIEPIQVRNGLGQEDFDVEYYFNFKQLVEDIPPVVRAMDNVIDRTEYPLKEQEEEAKAKRRMGLGFTGLANTLEILGMSYGSPEAIRFAKAVSDTIMINAYIASSDLAAEKGSFPAYDPLFYSQSKFIKRLPSDVQERIARQGIRNSHLISIAPTGTISFTADNVSSGMEPVFAHEVDRIVQTELGPQKVKLKDYAWNYYGVKGKTADELSVDEHLNMQIAVQPYVDSAVSKTINVGDNVSFDEFKDVYMKAWKGGLKGVTTFRLSGKRYGILTKSEPEEATDDGGACFIDPATGQKECS